ncbi:acetate kinase [Rhizobium binae]|uniref:Acetate kinase n=1 Tax=Rhizobium binae TaxID=1138190 RepID=A0ABV2MHA7_9HYPH|nr:acetate/propionate family kinase [Rhizobium binae]MBX4961517.1 acetate/propionate family kinase [Rhizobium binae]MBX4991457.1 acetate/propionate family kinase [Rhizobium binae]NKL48562.1 acetate/propionate family kinase [Rhizobium leguminosarum bv. viciae]QSY81524.1 acetate/propionate family kinase [Rhizobium binae]
MSGTAITFNTGSSSLKIGVFKVEAGFARPLARGTVMIGKGTRFKYTSGTDVHEVDLPHVKEIGPALLAELLPLILPKGSEPTLVGHRIIHGGLKFTAPVLLDSDTEACINQLVPLAPLHLPCALEVVRAVRAMYPDVLQTASFDTAFHTSQCALATRLAIPREMHDAGIRRYGFHGLSYKFVSQKLKKFAPDLGSGRVVCAHLGNGASLCGMVDGVSKDTSMGFSCLDGVPMATRPGSIDAGVLIHLLRNGFHDADRLEHFLYHGCGLLGVSGVSGDVRVLMENFHPAAREALDLFCFRIAGEIGRLAVSLGGIDAIVFTAGIGENQPEVRKGVARHLAWMGLELSESANKANATVISGRDSTITAFIIPTDEEQAIVDETLAVVNRHKL